MNIHRTRAEDPQRPARSVGRAIVRCDVGVDLIPERWDGNVSQFPSVALNLQVIRRRPCNAVGFEGNSNEAC